MHYSRLITILIVTELTTCYFVFCKRSKYVQDTDDKDFDHEYLWKIFGAISRAEENLPFNGRKFDRSRDNIKYLYNTLSNTVDDDNFNIWLRQEPSGIEKQSTFKNVEAELAGLVEMELMNTLAKKTPAILNKPFVQKKGMNDFLVIKSDLADPFVTVVPNDIYYNVEKKCVNWLDDCNQKGLRNRLLRKIHGPYK